MPQSQHHASERKAQKFQRLGFVALIAVVLLVSATYFVVRNSSDSTKANDDDTPGGTGGSDTSIQETYSSQMGAEELADSTIMPDEDSKKAGVQSQLDTALATAVEDYFTLNPLPGHVTVSITATNNSYTTTYLPEETYQTASVVKLEVLAMIVDNYDSVDDIPSWITNVATDMIADSDNEATTRLLFNVLKGHKSLREAHVYYGLSNTTESDDQVWGKTNTTAGDQLKLINLMMSEEAGFFDAEQIKYMKDILAQVSPDQAWGISSAAYDTETAWLKNGWDVVEDLDNALLAHSVGLYTDSDTDVSTGSIVIMTSGATDFEQVKVAIAELSVQARFILAQAEKL